MVRRKLFSESQALRQVICRDCGHVMESGESTSRILCPKCGGNRFDISLFTRNALNHTDETPVARKSILSAADSQYERALKENGGKILNAEDFEKTFSNHAEDMIEKGFANTCEEGYEISSDAYAFEKLFCRLGSDICNTMGLPVLHTLVDRPGFFGVSPFSVIKANTVEEMAKQNHLPDNVLILLRRAHSIPGTEELMDHQYEDWVKDSHILLDLKNEFEGETFGIEEFIRILRDRYPDAPENIMDILTSKCVITIDGGKVTINK